MEKMTTAQRIIFRIIIVLLLLVCARLAYLNKKQQRLEKEHRELYQEKNEITI